MAGNVIVSKRLSALAFLLTCVAFVSGGVAAQALPKLTVQSFVLSSDTANPQVEVPFQLIVRVHVRERVDSIDTLILPILAELELRGDQRVVRSTRSGTDYTETITVLAHHTGTIAIAPATLQAVDARDGRAKQYSSNPLTITVGGGSLDPLAGAERFARSAWHWAVRIAIWGGSIIVVVALAALIFHHRPVRVPAPSPEPLPPQPPPAPARSRRDQLSDALTVLRAERSRGSAVRVRAAVWRMIGASEGETLADVLQRPDTTDARMRTLLRSLERAAFTYDADLMQAIDDACASLEAILS
ncbi:MAG TPA: BatD family protein [Candidatus Baltobacteraceae bacterium]|nr:BatD family protein [Candidatus Baltobacteraceae bacterium]